MKSQAWTTSMRSAASARAQRLDAAEAAAGQHPHRNAGALEQPAVGLGLVAQAVHGRARAAGGRIPRRAVRNCPSAPPVVSWPITNPTRSGVPAVAVDPRRHGERHAVRRVHR